MRDEEKKVEEKLSCDNSVGIVIESDTKFTYTNQSGGYACKHPEIIGAFLPLPMIRDESLTEYFCGDKYGGWCDHGIDEEDADFIDTIIHDTGWRCDRDKLKESMEAWIFIKSDRHTGVFVFPNSD